jgi:hypothetical protein
MVGRDLLPEALSQGPRRTVLVDTTLSFAVMFALQLTLAR